MNQLIGGPNDGAMIDDIDFHDHIVNHKNIFRLEVTLPRDKKHVAVYFRSGDDFKFEGYEDRHW